MDKELEIAELEVKYITEMPAGSNGIINSLPFPGWKEPKPLTKADMDEVIAAFKANPEYFKHGKVERWQ